jgi:transposase
MSLTDGCAAPQSLRDWRAEPVWFCSSPTTTRSLTRHVLSVSVARSFADGWFVFSRDASTASVTNRAAGESPFFPPEVALHLVKLACEMPDGLGRSFSLWDCQELAQQLKASGVVENISTETVRRILQNHRLKPWRVHMWLGAKTPRDEAFRATVTHICDLYTRRLNLDEMVLCVDEKTSLQPRPRKLPTIPARPNKPVRTEHEYKRDGALNLFAAFDTRSGRVYARTYRRKRQAELINFLEYLDNHIATHISKIHIVCDNLRTHKGKEVLKWLLKHPRFRFHYTPVHCSWMNQVEQWFSILQRKRLKVADFKSLEDLRQKLAAFVEQWNQKAHPFKWTSKSVAKVMAYAEPLKAAA